MFYDKRLTVFYCSQILNAKLKRMEQLLHLKEVRIEDLENRLQHVQAIKLAHITDIGPTGPI